MKAGVLFLVRTALASTRKRAKKKKWTPGHA
jgi:hypothetical protein